MVGRFVDRLSELPDEILHQILSSDDLDMKQVIQTSILSKRWKTLWADLLALNFNQQRCLTWNTYQFTNFVNTVLVLRASSENLNIHKFSLTIAPRQSDNFPIEQWVSFAVTSLHAQQLHLKNIGLRSTSLLGHVNTLRLDSVILPLSDPAKGELLLSLGSVENLMMEDCDLMKIRKLTIAAPLLNYLLMGNDEWGCRCCDFVLCAPNLTSLKLKGHLYKDYELGNLASVSTADIHISTKKMKMKVFVGCLNQILIAISNVKSLTLSANAFQVFVVLPKGMKHVGNAFHNLKFLKLTEWQKDGRIVALGKLLKYFTFVETLVLERTKATFGPKKMGRDWGSQLSFRCKFSHLKSIEVRNLDGCENELKFLEFLLKNAMVLESITLKEMEMIPVDKEKELLEFSKELQLLYKASSSVKVVLMIKRGSALNLKSPLAHLKPRPQATESDYLGKVSLETLKMKKISHNTGVENSLPPNPVVNNQNRPYPDTGNSVTFTPGGLAPINSTSQTGDANTADWREQTYQKIQAMKELYLPDLNEMYEIMCLIFQQHDFLAQLPKEHTERLKKAKNLMECILASFEVSKCDIPLSCKDAVDTYEKLITDSVNLHRSMKPIHSHQGQLQHQPLGGHTLSIPQQQQPQFQNPQLQLHGNHMNPQMQPVNVPNSANGSVPSAGSF